MKIEGPSRTGSTKGTSKSGAKKGAGDASFSGMVDDAPATESAQGASGAAPVIQIDALLSLQTAAEGGGRGARKPKDHAQDLLDQLDKIRLGLLSGGVPVTTLQNLARMVGAQRENIMDPELSAVLEEIDLRVQVELAKYQRD